MTLMQKFLGAAATLALSAGAALAEPAIIFDLGGKFDKSFNEAAFNGAERWKEEAGGEYREIELQSDAQREQALRRFAEAGSNPIVMAGFAFGSALEEVAGDYPDTSFVIIDMVVDAPNVRSVVFNEHEGSFLVGMMAAKASESNTVGFIGGAQISQGADVIYAAAGGTGLGVLQTAADEGILSIGVDSNQNYLHPGSVLTSMLKRVDNAVYEAMTDGPGLETGFNVMGLSNDGVGYALDDNNASLVSDDMKAAVEDAKAKIVSGEIAVHDYMSNESCPDLQF